MAGSIFWCKYLKVGKMFLKNCAQSLLYVEGTRNLTGSFGCKEKSAQY